jgi:integrase
MAARTRNTYRAAAVAFCNWCVETNRFLLNPFLRTPKADEKSDQRRSRRALNEDELGRLLDVAHRRPLLDARTIRRGKRKGETTAKLSEKTHRRLGKLGHEQALIYKTLILTGLRKGELASITIAQAVLDEPTPYLVLHAADEKNREGATVPLRGDLAEDQRQWIAGKEATFQEAARLAPMIQFESKHVKGIKRNQCGAEGRKRQYGQQLTTVPSLPLDTPLFTVPTGLVRILDRDS